jgi:hypothetical protein
MYDEVSVRARHIVERFRPGMYKTSGHASSIGEPWFVNGSGEYADEGKSDTESEQGHGSRQAKRQSSRTTRSRSKIRHEMARRHVANRRRGNRKRHNERSARETCLLIADGYQLCSNKMS